MSRVALLVLAALAFGCAQAPAQPGSGPPGIGYLYPSGGKQGTTVRVTAGGQNLRGASSVCVIGEGLSVSVVEYVRALNNKQLGDIGMHIRTLIRKRLAESGAAGVPRDAPHGKDAKAQEELPELPDHPLVRGLDLMNIKELDQLRKKLFDPKRQQNAQIGDNVILDVTVDPAAAPGYRELRIVTGQGITNPLWFQVGNAPEVLEEEPNEPVSPPQPALELPVVVNGQIMPGDVDRFRFRATKGEKLVLEAQARRLVPYLADAVPGWFQATLAVYDPTGKELAFADDYRSDPDPVILFEVPEDGNYAFEIRDSIYRGREDFVYRVSVGAHPFITGIYPLGGQLGSRAEVSATGWNLPWDTVLLDTSPGGHALRMGAWQCGQGVSNAVLYQVSASPEVDESEEAGQRISPPTVINGRISTPGERDLYTFQARRGEALVAEVHARRLGSALDSLLSVTDESGHALALNDDHEDRGAGLITHHADSRLTFTAPADGTYRLALRDAQNHGGQEYAYRLSVGPPQPGFSLRVAPSSVNLTSGRAAPLCVHALREDGFDGEISLELMGAPPGFTLDAPRIPAGADKVRVTLSAPRDYAGGQVSLGVAGKSLVAGETLARPAVPSQDMMQAFAYRHLVPSQALIAQVTPGRRFAPVIAYTTRGPVRIPEGGAATVQVSIPAGELLKNLDVQLSEPPEGLALREVRKLNNALALVLAVDGGKLKAGYADNAILEVLAEVEIGGQGGQGKKQKRRISMGYLPALPFEVCAPQP